MRNHPGKQFITQIALLSALIAWSTAQLAASPPAMKPFPVDYERAEETLVDMSRFLEAPAGKDGFISIKKGHLVKPNGERFFIWGVNVCGAYCFPSKEQASLMAADLARYGVNAVRFHHMDNSWGKYTNVFDPEREDTRHLSVSQMDKLDFFIAELKKRGIYSNINMNVSRRYRKNDGVKAYNILGYGKGVTYYDERMIELQIEFAEMMATHYNPYTRSEYRNEPAIVAFEMVNENSLIEAWVTGRLVGEERDKPGSTWTPIPKIYADDLTDKYNAWLEDRLSAKELTKLRGLAGVNLNERIPRLKNREDIAQAAPERVHYEAKFLMELEETFFLRMRTLFKEKLKVKTILVGNADHHDGINGYPHILSNMTFPLIDGHGYWQHPKLGADFYTENNPMVNDPYDSTVVQFARTPVAGRPFTISETNHPFPAEHASEGIPTLTAYAVFHDWDGIYWFTYGQPRTDANLKTVFALGADPVKMTNLAACAPIFYRRDLQAARKTILRAYSREEIIQNLGMPWSERPFFTKGFARSTPLQHATRFSLEPGAQSSPFPPKSENNIMLSDTGEIVWDHSNKEQGFITIDSPRFQALIGFVNNPKVQNSTHLGIDVDNEFCTVYCVALDDRPIARASRLLLVTVARASQTGFEWGDEKHHTVAKWGEPPATIEPVTGTITLRALDGAKRISIRPLAGEGRPLTTNALEAKRDGKEWKIHLDETATTWRLLEVER